MPYFLGVDAGGTKTRAVIIDEKSKVLGEESGGSGNYHNIGIDQVSRNVYQTIAGVLSKSYLDFDKLAWTTLGIAGYNTKKDKDRLNKAFSSGNFVPLKNKYNVVNDTKIALYTGAIPPALVVVCGTGSNVYGKNDHGESAMAGDWGHFLGDRGSGYQLAKNMFSTVVAEYDQTAEPTHLTQKLNGRLGTASIEDLVDWYNDTKPTVREISDFAPLVISAAEEGDEVAKQLVDQTIAELGKAVIAVIRKLKMEGEMIRIVIAGGLFESKYFRAVFEGHVTALVARVRIIKPLVSAAVGAAIMAKREYEKTTATTESVQVGKGKFIAAL